MVKCVITTFTMLEMLNDDEQKRRWARREGGGGGGWIEMRETKGYLTIL